MYNLQIAKRCCVSSYFCKNNEFNLKKKSKTSREVDMDIA